MPYFGQYCLDHLAEEDTPDYLVGQYSLTGEDLIERALLDDYLKNDTIDNTTKALLQAVDQEFDEDTDTADLAILYEVSRLKLMKDKGQEDFWDNYEDAAL